MKPEVEQRTLVHILDVVVRVTDVQFAFTNDHIALALLPAFMVVPGLVIELVESKTEYPQNFINILFPLEKSFCGEFSSKKVARRVKGNLIVEQWRGWMLLMGGYKKKKQCIEMVKYIAN